MAEKPVCLKCGVPHWRFVRCDDVEHAEAKEQATQQARSEAARETERLRVMPRWSTPEGCHEWKGGGWVVNEFANKRSP